MKYKLKKDDEWRENGTAFARTLSLKIQEAPLSTGYIIIPTSLLLETVSVAITADKPFVANDIDAEQFDDGKHVCTLANLRQEISDLGRDIRVRVTADCETEFHKYGIADTRFSGLSIKCLCLHISMILLLSYLLILVVQSSLAPYFKDLEITTYLIPLILGLLGIEHVIMSPILSWHFSKNSK